MQKVIKFIFTSGIGFIIDFIIYNILVYVFNINVDISNMISSLVGVSFVFFTSVKRIFGNNVKRIPLKYKYLMYIVYQFVLIILVSKIIILLNNWLFQLDISFMKDYSKIVAKVCITPFTMLINYIVMKKLTNI